MTSEAETFTYPIAGRTIVFRRAKAGQLLMLQRLVLGLQAAMDRATTAEERGVAFSTLNIRSLDLVESLVVDPADVEFLQEQLLLGVIDVEDLRPILSGGKEPVAAAADDAAPQPKKRAPRKGIQKAARAKK